MNNIDKVDIKENNIYKLNDKLLTILLKDRSSKKNIIWATDNYSLKGSGYYFSDNISLKAITGRNGAVIKPRTKKSKAEQSKRIKQKAEVFTPSWICNAQNNLVDNEWFDRENVFNIENQKDKTWQVINEKINFPEDKTWQDYVNENRLEISCGEAPYLVSRYDTVTGEWLEVKNRIGLLDRKLRIVNENTENEKDWYEWAIKAFQSTYGFEWQGDSLLIARENLLYTFIDYYLDRFKVMPINEYLEEVAKIISWNIWQMDGLKFVIPNSCKPKVIPQISMFDDDVQVEECPGCKYNNITKHTGIYSVIKDWDKNIIRKVVKLKGEKEMKFDVVIGNPPYQDILGEYNGTVAQAKPIYHLFIEQSISLSNKYVSLITPSLWMTSGTGLSSFRKKMLKNSHLLSLIDFENSDKIFNNVNIAGGVSFFLYKKDYAGLTNYIYTRKNGSVSKIKTNMSANTDIFIRDPEANQILNKIGVFDKEYKSFMNLVSTISPFAKGQTGVYDNLFKQSPSKTTVKIYKYGRKESEKIAYVERDEIIANYEWINKHKVFVSKAGEVSAKFNGLPFYGEPGSCCSETYILIGPFNSKQICDNVIKYANTNFYKFLISQIKKTQNAARGVYKYVPMQDFSKEWTDKKLFEKYKLTSEEIKFINSIVNDNN